MIVLLVQLDIRNLLSTIVLTGHHNVYRIQAASTEEKDEWMKCIRASISRDPFYEMLQNRKKKATHQQEET